MIDLSLNTNQIITGLAIVAYIIIISISTGKYHHQLTEIKSIGSKIKLKLISELNANNSIKAKNEKIKRLKRKSYLFLILVGIMHLIIAILISSNFLSVAVPFLVFSIVLIDNYWLKGSIISGFIKNIPVQSDYRG